MIEEGEKNKLDDIYEHVWAAHEGGEFAILDESLAPRPADLLYDLAGQVGLGKEKIVLDVGCGRGEHTCRLAQRFGCRVIGLDPVISNLAQAEQVAAKAGVNLLATFRQGTVEAIPCDDETFDLIWCQDVLAHVVDLGQAIKECQRVIKPDGTILIYTTLATDLLEPQDTKLISEPLGIVIENLVQTHVEQMFKEAGLYITSTENLSSEPIEYLEEQQGRYSKELMRIARMRRERERFIGLLGQSRYETALALYYWGIYLLLGKLNQVVYVLKK